MKVRGDGSSGERLNRLSNCNLWEDGGSFNETELATTTGCVRHPSEPAGIDRRDDGALRRACGIYGATGSVDLEVAL